MAEEPESAAQKTANLARVRDNQRRSRARRREYLSELEEKWRICEHRGIEASAEIQAAARRVVEENKRLRQLLYQHGILDVEIDGMTAGGQLESMLGHRQACGSDCSGSFVRRQSCDPALLRAPTIAPAASTSPISAAHVPSQTPLSNGHGCSPHLSGQVTPQAPLFPENPQYPTPYPHSFPEPVNRSQSQTTEYNSIAPDDKLEWLNYYNTKDFITGTPQPNLTPTPFGSSSCYAAASAVRTLKPDAGYELEMELGCSDGRECEVPNDQVFGIMDRYT